MAWNIPVNTEGSENKNCLTFFLSWWEKESSLLLYKELSEGKTWGEIYLLTYKDLCNTNTWIHKPFKACCREASLQHDAATMHHTEDAMFMMMCSVWLPPNVMFRCWPRSSILVSWGHKKPFPAESPMCRLANFTSFAHSLSFWDQPTLGRFTAMPYSFCYLMIYFTLPQEMFGDLYPSTDIFWPPSFCQVGRSVHLSSWSFTNYVTSKTNWLHQS